ncbi:hypothetical protein PHK61_06730 [Actinomycetospora lutea]|uniref:hypothetical protein n=1 Tax=Actinomycetospora lutea TaxID=663604 RepID=UPI0023657454|nr:hypothetical protein [Actinomycetospora lutea]MDD7938110.1 hypothetical protein [Actinomycetospora lutea]
MGAALAGDDESRRDDQHPGTEPDSSATQVHRTSATEHAPPGESSAGSDSSAAAEGEGATAVHPTASSASTESVATSDVDTSDTATPPEGIPQANRDTLGGAAGTQRYDVPTGQTPGPWQPGAATGTPASPWGAAPGAAGTGQGPWGTAAFPGAGGPGHSQTGQPQPGYPPPGYGPPPGQGGPGGPGGPYGYTGPFGPPPGAGGSGPRRKGLVIGIAVAVVLLLLATTVVLLVTRQPAPSETLAASVADVRGWEGATYRGRFPDAAGAQANLEITVDRTGNAAGTIVRDGGGRAEFVLAGREQAIRADRAWWEGAAPRPELADRLTDQWLSDAFTVLPRGLTSWVQPPSALADRLSAPDVGERDEVVVGGRDARVLTPGSDGRSVTVVDDEPPTLVAFDLPGFGTGRTSPVAVDRAAPAALRTVADLSGQAPTMKSYIVAITERPRLALSVEGGESTCRTPTCTVTVRLVNSGTIATTGTIVVTLNDVEVARHPFSSAPGSNLAFPTTANNPVYDQPGASISALWRARVEGGR